MKVEITDVGEPVAIMSGKVGINIVIKYNGKYTTTFVTPDENFNLALQRAINRKESQEGNMAKAMIFAKEVGKLIGSEIELP